MEQLQEPLRQLRRRWWLVPLTAIVAVVVVLAVDLLVPPSYRTRARHLITPAPLEDQGDLVDSTEALDRPSLTSTYAEIFKSPTLQRQAAAVVGIEDVTAYSIGAVVLPETHIVQLTVTGPDPALAQRLANRLGAQVIAYMQQFSSVYELHELDAAPLVEEAYSPRPLRDAAVALVLGAVFGGVLAVGIPTILSLVSLPPLNSPPPRQQAPARRRRPVPEEQRRVPSR